MQLKYYLFLVLSISVMPHRSSAEAVAQFFSEVDPSSHLLGVGLQYDFSGDLKKDSFFLKSVGGDFSVSQSEFEQSSNSTETLKAQAGSFFLSTQIQKANLTISGVAEATPEIDYQAKGGSLSLRYPLLKNLSFSVGFGRKELEQSFTFKILSQNIFRTFLLNQESRHWGMAWSFLEGWQLRFDRREYSYDKSTSQLTNALNSQFFNRKASTLISSFSNIPRFSTSVGLSYELNDQFDLDFQWGQSELLVDQSLTQTKEVELAYWSDHDITYRLGVLQITNETTSDLFLFSIEIPFFNETDDQN